MAIMKFKIKHFDVVSVSRVGAVFGLIIGFIYGIIFASIVSIIGVAAAPLRFGPIMGLGAVVSIIVGIILGLVVGVVIGAIYSFFYNVSASVVGPIEVDLET